MDRRLQRGRLHVREQHQHARGRQPPHRLPHGADAHAQRLRPRQGPAQGEGREPRGPGHPRGAHRDHLGQAARAAVRGPDQDQARQLRDHRLRQRTRSRSAWPSTSRSTRPRRARSAARRSTPPRRASPRARRATWRGARARWTRRACRASCRLLRPRPRQHRDLPGRGRLGRRLGDHGAPVELPGDPAPARQDHQRGEGPDRQGPLQHRDPGDDHRDGHRHRRGLRHREGPVPQADHHDRRRRGRRPHPHAHPDLPLPAHAAGSSRRASSTSPARRSTRSSRATRSSTSRRRSSSRTGSWTATSATSRWRTPRGGQRPHQGALPALPARAEGARGLGRQPARHASAPRRSTSCRPTAWSRPTPWTSRSSSGRRGRRVGRARDPHRGGRGRRGAGRSSPGRSRPAPARPARSRSRSRSVATRELAGLRGARTKLRDQVGTPPFRLTRGVALAHRRRATRPCASRCSSSAARASSSAASRASAR